MQTNKQLSIYRNRLMKKVTMKKTRILFLATHFPKWHSI